MEPIKMIPSDDPARGIHAMILDVPDANGGDVTLTVKSDPPPGEATAAIVGAAARGTSPTPLDGASDFYAGWTHVATGRVGITLRTGTTSRALASLTPSSPPGPGVRTLEFDLRGTVLSLSLRDEAAGLWLQPDGTWSPAKATALAVADGSLRGPGYGGYYHVAPGRRARPSPELQP